MKNFGLFRAAIFFAAGSLATAVDAAATFNFGFSAPWFLSTDRGSGSGQLFADLQGDGTYKVTGVLGSATTNAGAAATSLTAFSAIALGGTPTISGSGATGYSLNSILLGDAISGYTVSHNPLDSNYTISSRLRTTGGGTFSVTLASSGAVPEAATWMTMILGFGIVGAGLRAQRRREAAFARL